MTVKRIYECNLCHVQRAPDQLAGVQWGADMRTPLQRPAREVEHHICIDCLIGLRAFTSPTEGKDG